LVVLAAYAGLQLGGALRHLVAQPQQLATLGARLGSRRSGDLSCDPRPQRVECLLACLARLDALDEGVEALGSEHEDEVLLRREVHRHRAQRHVGGVCDLGERRLPEPLGGEQLERRALYRAASALLLAFP